MTHFLKIFFFTGVILAAATTGATAEKFTPQRPIELVVMAGQGGGADRIAQRIVGIAKARKLLPQPLAITYKRRGHGAEAMNHLAAPADPDHVLMITLNSFFTAPLRQHGIARDPLDYAPIARLGEDSFVLWVSSARPIDTLRDFIEAARAKQGKWLMGGTGFGSEDEILTHYLNAVFGLEMTYRGLEGGGAVANALAAGYVDSTVNNPAEMSLHREAGRVRPLASFNAERSAALPEVPTISEYGHSFQYRMQRALVGPPEMSEAARAYYADVFRLLFESEGWTAYRRENGLDGAFMTGPALRDYWRDQADRHRRILAATGRLE